MEIFIFKYIYISTKKLGISRTATLVNIWLTDDILGVSLSHNAKGKSSFIVAIMDQNGSWNVIAVVGLGYLQPVIWWKHNILQTWKNIHCQWYDSFLIQCKPLTDIPSMDPRPFWHSAHPKAVGIPTASGAKYPGRKWGKVRKFILKIIQVLFGKHAIGICGYIQLANKILQTLAYVCPVLTASFPKKLSKVYKSTSIQQPTIIYFKRSIQENALTFVEHPHTSILVGSLGTPGWHHFGLVRSLAVKIKTAGLGPPPQANSFPNKKSSDPFFGFWKNWPYLRPLDINVGGQTTPNFERTCSAFWSNLCLNVCQTSNL